MERFSHGEDPLQTGEIFDPEKELREILKYPKKERRAKLDEFKEKLVCQKRSMAEVVNQMIEELRANPHMSYREMYDRTIKMAKKYGMNKEQEANISFALENYEVRHNAVERVCEEYPDTTPMYRHLFQRAPIGKVELLKGPITLYLKCHNAEDFILAAFIAYREFDPKQKFDDEFKTRAQKTEGIKINKLSVEPELENAILLGNTSLHHDEDDDAFIHEEQHAINTLFERPFYPNNRLIKIAREKISQAKSLKEKEKAVHDYLYEARKEAEFGAKDEFLAYYKEGTSIPRIFQKLSLDKENGGYYDFLEKNKKQPIISLSKNEVLKEVYEHLTQKILVEEYKKLLEDAATALEKLESSGFSKDEIIALFTYEPFSKWAKTAARMTEK